MGSMGRDSKIFSVLTLLVAVAAAIGTLMQVWVSASQELPIPKVQAENIAELRVQFEERRQTLKDEVQNLDNLINELALAESALERSSNVTHDAVEKVYDSWWLSILKAFAVYILLVFTMILSVFALVIDLVGLLWGHRFPLLSGLWEWSWTEVTIGWFWSNATAISSTISIVVVLLTGMILGAMDDASKNEDAECA
ncbi:MAG: hypothetical protein GYB21_19505 [Oceanospirillales bacterium]|nr:hypothetical protein [Oceanospirillales bacterium]